VITEAWVHSDTTSCAIYGRKSDTGFSPSTLWVLH